MTAPGGSARRTAALHLAERRRSADRPAQAPRRPRSARSPPGWGRSSPAAGTPPTSARCSPGRAGGCCRPRTDRRPAAGARCPRGVRRQVDAAPSRSSPTGRSRSTEPREGLLGQRRLQIEPARELRRRRPGRRRPGSRRASASIASSAGSGSNGPSHSRGATKVTLRPRGGPEQSSPRKASGLRIAPNPWVSGPRRSSWPVAAMIARGQLVAGHRRAAQHVRQRRDDVLHLCGGHPVVLQPRSGRLPGPGAHRGHPERQVGGRQQVQRAASRPGAHQGPVRYRASSRSGARQAQGRRGLRGRRDLRVEAARAARATATTSAALARPEAGAAAIRHRRTSAGFMTPPPRPPWPGFRRWPARTPGPRSPPEVV